MPPFVLPDEEGRLVSLDHCLARGTTVISFNRGHWCPYCRLNADARAKFPILTDLDSGYALELQGCMNDQAKFHSGAGLADGFDRG